MRIAFSEGGSEPCANNPRITQLKNTTSRFESLLRSNRNSSPPPVCSATNEVASDLCSNIEASQEDCTVLVADRIYLSSPEVLIWHVSVGHFSSNSRAIQEAYTIHRRTKVAHRRPKLPVRRCFFGTFQRTTRQVRRTCSFVALRLKFVVLE